MKKIISMKNVSKDYKVLLREPGVKRIFENLFARKYQIYKAVNNVTLDIFEGEIVGWLGTNGAGKSTTIKMMTGIVKPTKGYIYVNDIDPHHDRKKIAKEIGVVFGQRTQLWWSLPIIETFKILKELYEITDDDYYTNIDIFSKMVRREILYEIPVRQLSLGQRMLGDIFAAFLHNPKIVFLDEPTIGLDLLMKEKIYELVNNLNKIKNTTVILTTHDMNDVDALCNRIVVIDKGKVIYDDSKEQMKKEFGKTRELVIRYEKPLNYIEEKDLEQLFQDVFVYDINIFQDNVKIVFDENGNTIYDLLTKMGNIGKIKDIIVQEISTERIIKSIYQRK